MLARGLYKFKFKNSSPHTSINGSHVSAQSFIFSWQYETSKPNGASKYPTPACRSYETESSQQAQLLSEAGLLCFEPNGSQVVHARQSRQGPKRRGRKPTLATQTKEERRKKKNKADRIYRKNRKDEFDKLRAIASRVERAEKMEHENYEKEAELRRLRGIEQEFLALQPMVTEFHRLEQMKSKFGGIEEMESKLRKFEQITSMFGGNDEMVTEIARLKNMESQYKKYEQMLSLNHQNAQPFFGVLQQQDNHGIQSVNFNSQMQGSMVDRQQEYHQMQSVNSNNPVQRIMVDWQQDYHQMQSVNPVQGSMVDWQQDYYQLMHFVNSKNQVQGSMVDRLEDSEISEMLPAAMSATIPHLVYSDAHVTEFIAGLDESDMNNDICLFGSTILFGECQTVGEYNFTRSLVLSANDFNVHSDVIRNDGPCILQNGIVDLMNGENSLRGELENNVTEGCAVVQDVSGLFNDFLNGTVGLF